MAGDAVVIAGSGFQRVVEVTLNGLQCPFNIDDDTQITAIVPRGATSGRLQVRSPFGSCYSADPIFVIDGWIVRRTITQPADGADFIVTLPAGVPTDDYAVIPMLVKGDVIPLFKPINESPSDRTASQFRCITSDDLATGDIVEFIIVI